MIFPILKQNCCLLYLCSRSLSLLCFTGRCQHLPYRSPPRDVNNLGVPNHWKVLHGCPGFIASQKHPSQLYSHRKNDVVNSFIMTGSNQLLFKGSVVNSIHLAHVCPHKELVPLASACQGSDTTLNLNPPVKRKQNLFLLMCNEIPHIQEYFHTL